MTVRTTGPSTDAHPPTGSLVIPRLQAGTSVAQLAYEALRSAILAMDVHHPDADLRLDPVAEPADLGRRGN